MDCRKSARIDEYISRFPSDIQEVLEQIRRTVKSAAPLATETISYGMPAFRQSGILVYFAAFKDHIGFFPTASGVAAFAHELGSYRTSKGTISFELDKPIPKGLIEKIVRLRVNENMSKLSQNIKNPIWNLLKS
jgi:uncharacterized protein YdhG (YjbR/CyaY superfamily)